MQADGVCSQTPFCVGSIAAAAVVGFASTEFALQWTTRSINPEPHNGLIWAIKRAPSVDNHHATC